VTSQHDGANTVMCVDMSPDEEGTLVSGSQWVR